MNLISIYVCQFLICRRDKYRHNYHIWGLQTWHCFRKKLCFDLTFETCSMLSHLLKCFEKHEMSEFPHTSKTLSLRRQKKYSAIDIQLYCICNLPECIDQKMVQCGACLTWYHYSCVEAPADKSWLQVRLLSGTFNI